jgi:hypothetical protein
MAHTHDPFPSVKSPSLKARLIENGSQQGWNAFGQLCDEGCDPDLLTWSLFLLYDEPVRAEDPKTGAGHFEMRPTRLDPSEARGDLSLTELDRIANLAAELQNQLPRLRQLPFVRELIARGLLPLDDLLNVPSLYLRDTKESRLNGLVNLGDLARKFGSQKKPQFTARLKEIFNHIHESTGQWHDRLVADILNDLKPDIINTEDSLKAWRHRNGCS